MLELRRVDQLRESGRMMWNSATHGWIANPREVVTALAQEGFAECKMETARTGRERPPIGGVWQGVNAKTGSVASAVWIQQANPEAIVVVDIDGEPVCGE